MHEGGGEGITESSFSRFPITSENLRRKSKGKCIKSPAKRSNASAIMCDYIVLHLLVLIDLTAG